jgi:uncharacterized membrane protein
MPRSGSILAGVDRDFLETRDMKPHYTATSVLLAMACTAGAAAAAESKPAVAATYPRHPSPDGVSCTIGSLPGVVTLFPRKTAGSPYVKIDLTSDDGEFLFHTMALPAPGGTSLGDPTLKFRDVDLQPSDAVSIDGRAIKAYDNEDDPAWDGGWLPDDDDAYRRALATGKRLEIDVVRDGKRERRAIALDGLRSDVAAAWAVQWRCE